MMLCRHCHRLPPSRPRGLCWSCYYAPGIRDRYKSESKFGNRGFGNHNKAEPPLPAEPTRAPPGTPEKMDVMRDRAARGEAIFHPDDVTIHESWLEGILLGLLESGDAIPATISDGGEDSDV